jgi:NAD(P)-dependent dehydrogenase (short-subunit alcohol dehydrogenase family)
VSPTPRNVVITGGGDSVCRVIAEAFLAQGDNVHICDLREESVSATVAANPGLRGTVADVGEDAHVERLFADAGDWMNGVDVLVNGVGIAGPHALTENTATADWATALNVNVIGMVRCIRKVLPGMKERRRGAILNFSSCSAQTAPPNRSVYVASKAAVDGLTRCLAREVGPYGITCNAIQPGAIENERLTQIIARNAKARGQTAHEFRERALEFVSLRRTVGMQEIAGYVVFLCSDEARAITGQLLRIDGNFEWEA